MAVEVDLEERVDGAQLAALKSFDPEEMVEDLDHITDDGSITLTDLYRRWERQNWSAYALDFSQDRTDWAALDEQTAERLRWLLAMFFQGEDCVTATLAPWVNSAPNEEMRIFLSTQLADEARHTVFFDRFYEHALGVKGDLQSRLDWCRPQLNQAYEYFFYDLLPGIAREVQDHPRDPIVFARGIAFYHLIVEGTLAVPGQKYILDFFRKRDIMPAFRSGFTAIARDESRHVGAGVRILRYLTAQEPACAGAVRDLIEEVLPITGEVFRPPNLDFTYLTVLGYDFSELNAFSVASLQKRLRGAGFPDMRTKTLRLPPVEGEPILPPRQRTAAQEMLHSVRDQVTPALIFEGLPMAFNPDAARGVTRTFQFDIAGDGGGTWTVRVADDACEVKQGPPSQPADARMETDADTWVAMSCGEISGDEAFMLGRLGSEGIFGLGLTFDKLFSGPAV